MLWALGFTHDLRVFCVFIFHRFPDLKRSSHWSCADIFIGWKTSDALYRSLAIVIFFFRQGEEKEGPRWPNLSWKRLHC